MFGKFIKNSVSITSSVLNNPNRWVNLLDALLAFAVTAAFGSASWTYFKNTNINPSLLALGGSIWLILFCLILR